MARSRSANHDLQREAVVGAATQRLARQSFPAASMNGIAAACGPSKVRRYRHGQGLLALIGESKARARRKRLTGLRPGGALSCVPFADEVVQLLDRGLAGDRPLHP